MVKIGAPAVFTINTKEQFVEEFKLLFITKSMLIYNITKYGFEDDIEYILTKLGHTYTPPKIMKVSKSIREQVELFRFIFDTDRECFVRIRNKSTGKYRAYPVNALQNEYKLQNILKSTYNFTNTNDLMYSLNTYNNMKSATDKDIFSIHLIAIDVDFDTTKMTLDEAMIALEKEYKVRIPTPNLIEFGHRIRLLYKLECVGATTKSKNLVRKVTETIASKLKDYGASGQAITTYARILGSVNTKNNSRIKIKYLNRTPYTLKELQDTILDKPEWLNKTTKKKPKTKVININNAYTLNLARLRDLEKIQKIRQDGFKEILCYLYRNYCLLAGMEAKEAEEAMLKFNSNFKNPRKKNKAEQDTRALERKQYLHRNGTILKLLDISEEEERKLHLETIISKKEKQRRNSIYNKAKYRELREISKKDEIETEKQKIISLKNQGLKNQEIANALEIPLKTLERRITQMRKESLLQ